MIYTASGKQLRRAIGFTGGMVAETPDSAKGKPASAVATKTVAVVRRRYDRNVPAPVGGK